MKKTYHNTSEYWGDPVSGLTIEDYIRQAITFGDNVSVFITADEDHIYANGVPIADRDEKEADNGTT